MGMYEFVILMFCFCHLNPSAHYLRLCGNAAEQWFSFNQRCQTESNFEAHAILNYNYVELIIPILVR